MLSDEDWRQFKGGLTVVHQCVVTDREKPTKFHSRNCPHAQQRQFRAAMRTHFKNAEWFRVADGAQAQLGGAEACDHCQGV
jgi:hypothetical protein